MNSVASVVIDLPAGCTTFSSDVGIDDMAAGDRSVRFSVLADNWNLGDAGDGNGHDNADWSNAELMCPDG
jgi:hypothetical protein